MVSRPFFCIDCGAANPTRAKFCFSCGLAFQGADKTLHGSGQTGKVKPGELLRLRYKVLSLIGQGGFGAVYKAEDTELGQRLVAVKEMSEQGLSKREIDEGVLAFKREALMLAGLMHEHLPRIYDHFEEDGHWYLLMDYIEGETLEEHFNKTRDGSLPLAMALKISLQLCEVLDYLHTQQPPIVFRDLKPGNIILTLKGNLFLIDFGIARHFKPGQAKDTIAFGSPGYAAPEQYGKTQTTPRADIYSLGAILHQMLSGTDPSLSPFRFAPLSGQDPALQQLITLMLEMDESKRPESIAVVRQSLQHITGHLTVPAHGRAGQLVPIPVLPTTTHHPALLLPSPQLAPTLIHEHHYGVVRAVAWSQDSMYAASATDAIVRVWNAHTGQNRCSYREHLGVIKHMAWSPTSTHIASISEENKIRIWDAFTGQTINIYPGDSNPGSKQGLAHRLAWSHDGNYLAVAGNKYIDIWNIDEHRVITRLRNKFFSGCRAICWSPDDTRLATAQASKVVIYRLDTKTKPLYYRYRTWINAVSWSPNGVYLASGGYDCVIHVWNIRDGKLVGVYQGHSKPISALAWSPDSTYIVSGSLAANINIWDAMTGAGAISYYAHPAGNVLTLAWSPDGHAILSGGSDCKVCVWHAP